MASSAGDEIWLADGTYRPDQGSGVTELNRHASFHIPWGVRVLGGFSGSEMTPDERTDGETILSGDLLSNDGATTGIDDPNRQDNSFHVVRMDSAGAGTMFDRLVILGGNANGDLKLGGGLLVAECAGLVLNDVIFRSNYSLMSGGGVFVGPTENNEGKGLIGTGLTFENNVSGTAGGGMYASFANVTLKASIFRNNTASSGGGLFVFSSDSVTLTGLTFYSNSAGWGGGATLRYGVINIQNSVFNGNEAEDEAGALFVEDAPEVSISNSIFSGNRSITTVGRSVGGIGLFDNGRTILTNLTFAGNAAANGPSSILTNTLAEILIRNVIIWPDAAGETVRFVADTPVGIGNSIIQGGLPTSVVDLGGNRFSDPMFVDSAGPDNVVGTRDDDLRLLSGSPAIEKGLNAALPSDILDLDEDGDTEEPLPIDVGGLIRVFDSELGVAGGQVDIGAHEFASLPIGVKNEEEHALPSAAESLVIYPNPAETYFKLSIPAASECPRRIQIVDVYGRSVGQEFGQGCSFLEELTVDVSGLAAGVYIVVVHFRTRTMSRLIVVTD